MSKIRFLGAVLALIAAPLAAYAAALDGAIARADGWVSWQVPVVTGAGKLCCFSNFRSGGSTTVGCDLDGRNWSFGTNDQVPPVPNDALAVYAHVTGGKVDKLRAVAASCPVKTKNEVRPIDDVAPADSVAWIARYATTGKNEADNATTALAYHAEPAATKALADLAGPSHPRDRRESALFWLGQARGADGAAIVERFATRDDDPDIREHAVFALSQSNAVDAYARLLSIAGSDTNEDVRSKALFWMAQMKDPRAEADITAAIRKDPSDDVREQAVFALSQLDAGADRALIAVIRGDYPRSAKEKALFWLGQSGSDEALSFMDEVLAKDARR